MGARVSTRIQSPRAAKKKTQRYKHGRRIPSNMANALGMHMASLLIGGCCQGRRRWRHAT
eukprot:4534348-Lingulodinium_polyedra.AAC.1